MQSELFRLATFSSLPMTASRLYPSRLSRLGFYYNAEAGCFVCHRCSFSADVASVDDERDLHQRHLQQSTICHSDVMASRDLPTFAGSARPPTMSTDAGKLFCIVTVEITRRGYLCVTFGRQGQWLARDFWQCFALC